MGIKGRLEKIVLVVGSIFLICVAFSFRRNYSFQKGKQKESIQGQP